MKIVEVFKKYFWRKETKKEIISVIIENLLIPENEKHLYLESLHLLSESELDSFYIRLAEMFWEIESENIKEVFQQTKIVYNQIKSQEKYDKDSENLDNSLLFNSW